MDSIIFDLDGTLWDSLDIVTKAWNEVLSKHNIAEISREELEGITGLQMPEIGRILFPKLDQETLESLLEKCSEHECKSLENQGGVIYEKVEDTLKKLSQKYQLYIVSNCQEGYIEAFYKYHNLEKYFKDYENPGRTGLSKGENIKLIIERNNLKNPVYVGDTQGDSDASKYAGIPFVYAKYGFGKTNRFDYCINQFKDLLEIF